MNCHLSLLLQFLEAACLLRMTLPLGLCPRGLPFPSKWKPTNRATAGQTLGAEQERRGKGGPGGLQGRYPAHPLGSQPSPGPFLSACDSSDSFKVPANSGSIGLHRSNPSAGWQCCDSSHISQPAAAVTVTETRVQSLDPKI